MLKTVLFTTAAALAVTFFATVDVPKAHAATCLEDLLDELEVMDDISDQYQQNCDEDDDDE
jgi:hypothetical protein